MKFQNCFRTQLMVIGFGAALAMANATHAQEIDNTVWDDNTNVANTTQQTPAQAQPANDLSVATDSGALNLAAIGTTSIVERGTAIPEWKPAKAWLLVSLLVAITLLGLYSLGIARRANQILNARSSQPHRRAALS